MFSRLHARTDSTGSDVMSDDEYIPYKDEQMPTLTKKTGNRRKLTKAGEQQKPQNRGRKPGQSKPRSRQILIFITFKFRLRGYSYPCDK